MDVLFKIERNIMIYINIAPYLRMGFVVLTLIFLILALVFRLMRKRKISDVMELFAVGFFFAYSLQFFFTFNFTSPNSYTNPNNIAYMGLFIVSIVLVIYKIIFFVRGR